MGWIRDITQCPRCGYEAALKEEHLSSWYRWIICVRCGYSEERFFNHEKYESLKNDPEYKDDDHDKLESQCWECEVIYPTGSYLYRRKGEDVFKIDSIKDGKIENLLEHLDEYDVCKHTFYKVRSWYIKNLHNNTTALFSEEEYHRCTSGAEDTNSETHTVTWNSIF